jgi:hypothetical protein
MFQNTIGDDQIEALLELKKADYPKLEVLESADVLPSMNEFHLLLGGSALGLLLATCGMQALLPNEPILGQTTRQQVTRTPAKEIVCSDWRLRCADRSDSLPDARNELLRLNITVSSSGGWLLSRQRD